MSTGHIQFEPYANGHIAISLTVRGQLVLKSSSVESIAREIELRKLKALRLDDEFEIALPANNVTLEAAGQTNLKYPLVAFKLVAACAWLADMTQLIEPERRTVRKAD
ncbi:hypothetical protein GTP55_13500 [Duganella sp. FT109W]|uniref:Uncharacterized protein n=1 Tax=Duganella margarita TaxID=2692170 RepID=A0ABW9WH50_9BURK|nr:hypothetical protein [Duganella margarita]MYN40389.1 hypothetical protein [Duganella margarita]